MQQTYELEQSMASVAAYILESLDEKVACYFEAVPENFKMPSIYFPPPEIEAQGMTLEDFRRIHIMYPVFFGKTLTQAHRLASMADNRIHVYRHAIPLLEDGDPPTATGRYLHAHDTNVRILDEDNATVQLAITWHTHHKYYRPDTTKIIHFIPNIYQKDL
ncbi:MAG: hypothetical protein NC311_10545 [Muribaculaceae bacterium]|nr:hypothetical protein [Muribaculaceae bacterium]